MEFTSKKLSDVVTVKQEFILTNLLPIPKNTICMISAKGGVGKTSLSLALTAEYINKHDGNVGLWLTEDEEGNVKYRVDTLQDHSIIPHFNQDRVLMFGDEPIHFAKKVNGNFEVDLEVIRSLKMHCIMNDIRLLVLDPLLAFFGGNENDNVDARAFMQPFINWCKVADITIIFIHHASKGEVQTSRGASAFRDAVRSAYIISSPMSTGNLGGKATVDEDKNLKGIRSIHLDKDNRGAISHVLRVHKTNPFDLVIVPDNNKMLAEVEINYSNFKMPVI